MDISSVAVQQFLKLGGKEEDLPKTVFGVRINLSSGYGDFGIASEVPLIVSHRAKLRCFTQPCSNHSSDPTKRETV